jgi:hypothetical protein
VADAEQGVVLTVAMLDIPSAGGADLPKEALSPSTYMIPQLIKVENGAIAQVEGLVKWMPFGYTSGWSELKN